MSNTIAFTRNHARFAVLAFLFAAATLSAQTFTTLHAFHGPDGANPYTALAQGTDGALYGTTIDGGANGSGNFFRMKPDGTLIPLYDFCSQSNCADGQFPVSALIVGTDGNFYGTTQNGGPGNFGTIYKVTSSGHLTTLHSFTNRDGAAPYGSLVLGIDGNFYGMANLGGTNGVGTIFKMSASGKVTTLYDFCSQANCADGQYPIGGIIQATDGNLYGTTHAGGNTSCHDGCGTVFRITTGGQLTTLHSFDGTDGEYPYGGVIQSRSGAFYGTTGSGGEHSWGTVFRMTPDGTITTLHSFDADKDGAIPYGLVQGSDGNFYGTTSAGGSRNTNYGTVFGVTAQGRFKTLHTFQGGTEGKTLFSGLFQGTSGVLYGTTYFGGSSDDDGTVFSVNSGLRPYVQAVPGGAKAGTTISLLGTNLSDATSVSFNGAAATFQVVSKSLIKATIPDGATTGKITVQTPHRTITSIAIFVVN